MKYFLVFIIWVFTSSSVLLAQTDNFADTFNEIQYTLGQGDAAMSYSLVSELVNEYPDSSKAWFLKSQIERQIIQYKNALESIQRAINLEPGVSAYYYQISSLFSDLNQYDKCVSYCDSVISLDSTHLFASILKAQALQKDGKIQEALDQYHMLHLRDSMNINFMKQIGSLHTKRDSLNDAIKWYLRAVNVDSTDVPSYTYLGNLYVRTKQYEEGLPILDKSLEVDSLNSWLYRFRGSLNIMGANLEEAENDFTNAIQLGDSTAFTFRHLGLSLYKQSKFEEAFPVYQTTVKLDPEDAQAWYYLGFCYKWKEDVEMAISCMDKALQLSVTPGISDIYSGLAQFSALQRNYEEAMHYYSRSYEWNSEDPVPLAQIGMLIEQTGGDKKEAKSYYESFLEKASMEEIQLMKYIRELLQIINEKLFMEGNLQRQD